MSEDVMIEPRKKTSSLKKRVQLPGDARALICSTFEDAFEGDLDGFKIDSNGWVYSEELVLTVGIRKNNEIRQKNFVASLDYNKQSEQAMNIIHTAVDAVASMLDQYLDAGGDIEMPLTWQDFDFEGTTVHLMVNGTNSDLEAQADELLGEAAQSIELQSTELTDTEAKEIIDQFKSALMSLNEGLEAEPLLQDDPSTVH